MASVSHHEGRLAGAVEARLRAVPGLDVTRVGDNVVARTHLGRARRVVLAGHLDTVPPNGNERARLEGDWCWGLGSVDMKSGLAVLLELARTVARPALDVTYVFYAGEEVAERHNGLEHLFATAPELVAADVAVLAEPTGARIEAGCQGTLRLRATARGERAHTARGWLGRNAVHALAPVLAALAGHDGRRVVMGGCEFREGLEAVAVGGGVAGNVVPDEAWVEVNHRFAPDRSPAEAEAEVRRVLEASGTRLEVEVLDAAPAAPPALDDPWLTRLVAAVGEPPRAKLGWTDVARFAGRGVPATNFGPGDPNLAHHAEERVCRADLDACYRVLAGALA